MTAGTLPKRPPPRWMRNAQWIEKHCRIPEGKDVGKPVRLRSWQKEILRGIYDSPTRRVIISVGRKNAKTALSAFLLLLHLVGPEAVANSQLYSTAQSRAQAAIIFDYAQKSVLLSPTLQPYVAIRDSRKELICRDLGTRYRALSAEATTALGLSPALCIHDELGQVRGPRSELYEALETATAAQESPLSIIISTQAPTDGDLLSQLIDDAKAKADPKTKLFLWTAAADADPFTEEAIKAANPAYGDFMNAAEVLAMAEDARRMPSREAEFRNLILNQRVEARSPFISRSAWESCAAEPEPLDGLAVFGGLDLSETTDLTALVLVGQRNGIWHVRPTFWLPADGLADRARKDRVPYDLWHREGFLETTPGKAIEYSYVAEYLRGLFDDLDIRTIAFDRFNFRHLKSHLLNAGFTEVEIENHFKEFGQGYVSMSPALRTLETEILNARLAHGGHPVLTANAAAAVVDRDPAGNRKLTKAKSTGRIDGLVSLAMALAVAETAEPPKPPSVYERRGPLVFEGLWA